MPDQDIVQRVVSYWAGQEIKLGTVLRQQRGKLQVESTTGKVERVGDRHVLAVLPHEGVDEAETAVREVGRDIDLVLLWETVLEQAGTPSLAEMATAYFGSTDAVAETALALRLLDDPVHFRRRGNSFDVRSRDEAEEISQLRHARARKAAARDAALAWVRRVVAAPAEAVVAVPPDLETFLRRTEEFVLLDNNSDAVHVLAAAHSALTPRQVGVRVLQRTGRLPDDADPYLLENGVLTQFPATVEDAAAALLPYVGHDHRTDLSSPPVFSIDDDDTEEVDDAVSVRFDDDGGGIVYIHIADPTHFIERDDPLDRSAADRALSLYLPTTTVTMLPRRLGCNLASLTADGVRPALVFETRFGSDGRLTGWDFHCAEVTLARRLNYAEADAVLASTEEHQAFPGRELAFLARITAALRAERQRSGAFNLSRPEVKIRVSHGHIRVKPVDMASPSRKLISELMILANRLTAEFAFANDIPVIYRVQDPPDEPVYSLETYDPVAFDREIRKLTRTRLSTFPQGHAGLGLDVYTQVSSPLRRYADLVIQRQLSAAERGEPLPYDADELLEVLEAAERTASQNRNLERDATRFWALEYLKRECVGATLPATVVLANSGRLLAEVHNVYVRGLLNTTRAVDAGDEIRVRIADVRPRKGLLVLETA